MTEPRSPIRALVASFLFTDLVGFSKGTVAEQYAAKSALSAILRDNLAPLQEADYRVKDTGDGALIVFLASPEHALYMALAITQDFARVSPTPEVASKSLRTGLNIGTVKEQMDLEARPNYIGDGINDAKRIMDFAHPGQIAASRSFYESVSCLDAMYAQLFSHLGAPDDKHGRSHELYGVRSDPAVLDKLKRDLATAPSEPPSSAVDAPRSTGPATKSGTAAGAAPVLASGPAIAGPGAPDQPRATFLGRYGWASLGVMVAAVALGSAFVALNGWRAEPVAAPMSTAPPIAKPSVETGVAGTAAAPKYAKDAKDAKDASAPRTPAPVAALPAATSASANTAPRISAPPAARQPMTTASGDQAATRCRRIIEKAELGEPLSPEEKKELANSCR